MSKEQMQCGDNLQYIYNFGKLSVSPLDKSRPYGEMWDNCPPDESWEVESLHITYGVTGIGEGAFADTGVADVYLTESLESIGKEAFLGCLNLQTVDIPDGLNKIGDRAFAETGLDSVHIPTSVEEIGEGAFQDCDNLSYAYVDAQTIGDYAFSNSALDDLKLGPHVRNVGDYAFADNDISGKVLMSGVVKLGDRAFYGNKEIEVITNDNILGQLKEEGVNARTPGFEDLLEEAMEYAETNKGTNQADMPYDFGELETVSVGEEMEL